MNLQNGIAAGLVLMAMAASGCGHVTQASSNPADPNVAAQTEASGQPCGNYQAAATQSPIYGGTAVSSDGSGQPYAARGYVESLYRPVLIVDQPVAPPPAAQQEPVYESQPSNGRYYGHERGHKRHTRSKGKSAAIVVGSAAAGAGIGALAGGDKGAAIGAASGGTAGFVYDRLTHNR
jgi:hypothetical protein